jgi:hypothetical protein
MLFERREESMRTILVAATTVFLMLSHQACAQSAEETVHFMLFGDLSKVYQGKNVNVLALDKCKYRVDVGDDTTFLIDFSLTSVAKAVPHGLSTLILYLGSSTDFLTTKTVGTPDSKSERFSLDIPGANVERVNRAIAYFRSTICQGRAF